MPTAGPGAQGLVPARVDCCCQVALCCSRGYPRTNLLWRQFPRKPRCVPAAAGRRTPGGRSHSALKRMAAPWRCLASAAAASFWQRQVPASPSNLCKSSHPPALLPQSAICTLQQRRSAAAQLHHLAACRTVTFEILCSERPVSLDAQRVHPTLAIALL